MPIIITPTESKKIHIANTSIEVASVYGRVAFAAPADGKRLEFATETYENAQRFADKQMMFTDLPTQAQVVELKEGEQQTVETALQCAKEYYEALGYSVEILL
jgi:hypothetical protein